MEKYHNQTILINDLLLDLKNPRHETLSDQTSILKELLDRQGDKMFKLAKDIATEGINPADLPIVTPDPNDPAKYIVLEGNRRIAVLMLLNNPGLSESAGKTSLKRRFEDLAKEYEASRIDSIECVVFKNREEAIHWIELRHTGENEGIGIVSWDAAAVARFNKGQSWIALQVVNYVKEKADLDPILKHQIDRMHLTNLARLVNDPDVRDALGITLEKGIIKGQGSPDKLVNSLTKVVKDIATREITVNSIRSKAQRQDYIEKLIKTGDIQHDPKSKVPPWELPLTSPEPRGYRERSLPATRAHLIPSNCILAIPFPRLNCIYKELKRLDLNPYPNCAAVMLRVFLELSVDCYIEKKGMPIHNKSSLPQKLAAVVKYMEINVILGRDDLKPVRTAISSRDSLFSVDTLHAYIHNKTLIPKVSELVSTWDNMQSFIEALWK